MLTLNAYSRMKMVYGLPRVRETINFLFHIGYLKRFVSIPTLSPCLVGIAVSPQFIFGSVRFLLKMITFVKAVLPSAA